ncbi:Fic family protein [Ligilactobacillus salivarius]|uniref:Fic family protein n=1 Tax=Ligilactobacillus salivarius TaxID=1624 RepID=UPI001CDA75EE|nr:Fic family protein [Ligilactobacillus salivarius]
MDYFPKPALIWNNEFEKLFTAPKVGEGGQVLKQVSLSDEELKEKLQLFCDIVNEYDTYKLSGEGWQTLGFLLYLYEAPFIWRVRDLYDLADKSKHREDVPIAVALIGQGKTGKSTSIGKLMSSSIDEHAEENYLQELLKDKNKSVTEKSIEIMYHLMKNKIFWNGNKRTATLVANKYMIDNGVGLINIPLYCWDEWNKLISDYYYDNDMSKIKEWTYKVGIQGIDIFKTNIKDKQ